MSTVCTKTLKAALLHSGINPLDAEVLLCFVLGKSRSWLAAHGDSVLTKEHNEHFEELCARRRSHEPVSYITGEKEFYGRSFIVTGDTLIPRPATEGLVDCTLDFLQKRKDDMRTIDTDIVAFSQKFSDDDCQTIIDVGTGSGCIAITLACEIPDVSLIATDISQPALHVAEENAQRHNVADRIQFVHCDLLESCADINQRFLVVSNPPYIPKGEQLMTSVADFEPAQALFSDSAGSATLSKLYKQAKSHSNCIGCIFECRLEQAKNLLNTD